jgi:UDP-N-acetylglucosamine enolpyruvyl transferase
MFLKITGPQRVEGEVVISGAKNAASKMMVASLLTSEEVVLHNFPRIDEIDIVRELVERVGAKVETREHSLVLHTPEIATEEVLGSIPSQPHLGAGPACPAAPQGSGGDAPSWVETASGPGP